MKKKSNIEAIEILKTNTIGHKDGKKIHCETCPTYALIIKGERAKCDCDFTSIKKNNNE